MTMQGRSELDLRRRSVHLRGLADIRQVVVADGPGVGGRLVEVRTPSGLAFDLALDRGGDILRLSWRGHELGWHSAVGAPSPWPALDAEGGLGFLRGFDGFLVTCGLDHHGRPAETSADHFRYPLRGRNVHPLHGRLVAGKAELLRKEIDWPAGLIRLRLVTRQASVFGEVLELDRLVEVGLEEPRIALTDTVTNRGFRPSRHGILYHVNVGFPLLDEAARLCGEDWALRDRLDAAGAVPDDEHVEVVESGPSPASGEIGIGNERLGVRLRLAYDPAILPVAALWRAFQSGVFALGLEPQTVFSEDPGTALLDTGERRVYRVSFSLDSD